MYKLDLVAIQDVGQDKGGLKEEFFFNGKVNEITIHDGIIGT
jgi:hypothetical protein